MSTVEKDAQGPSASGEQPPAPVKSAERAVLLIEHVAGRGVVTFAEIVTELGLPRSSAHGLVHTLMSAGWLERTSDGRFSLGLRAWEVGQAYGGHRELVDVARPFMARLTEETGETVQMALLDGAENVYIAISHSRHPIRLASSVGVRLPAHATGIGKALLSLVPEEDLRHLVATAPLAQMTPNTVTEPARVVALVDRARRTGFARDDEEYVLGCVCVAVPIGRDVGRGGTPVALSITVPTSRVEQPWPGRYLEGLQRVAQEIRAEAGLA